MMRDQCLKSLNDKLVPMVLKENGRQLDKWGIQELHPCTWLTVVAEELGEMSEAILKYEFEGGDSADVVKEAIQTATVSLKIAEMFLEGANDS